MGEVVGFNRPTLADIPAEKVLEGAQTAKLSTAIVIGETAEGMLYHASSTADIGEMLYHLEVFKHQLMMLASE